MAVYLVEGPEGTKPRMIETRTKAGAINHVAGGLFKATALNTSDLVKHLKNNIEVETITEKEEEKTADLPLKDGEKAAAPAPDKSTGSAGIGAPKSTKEIVKEGFAPKAAAAK